MLKRVETETGEENEDGNCLEASKGANGALERGTLRSLLRCFTQHGAL